MNSKKQRTTTHNCRPLVQRRTPFEISSKSLYAEWVRDYYVVYSYGEHFPMYVWDGARWLGNDDKYSPSTTRHQSAAHPYDVAQWMHTEELKRYIYNQPANVLDRMTWRLKAA